MTDNLRDAIRRGREPGEPLTDAQLREGWQGVEARIDRPRATRVWAVAAMAVTAALVAAGVFVLRSSKAIDIADPACASVEAGRITTGAGCESVAGRIDDDRVELGKGTVVERTMKNRVKVVRGRVRFDVRPRKTENERLEVRVSGGTIVVVGTAFAVTQDARGGNVVLEHGNIRFVWDDGTTDTLERGQSLTWPRPTKAETPPTPEHEQERPPDVRHEPADPKLEKTVEAIMQRQFQLRAQRRYDEAMTVLRQAAADKHFTRRQRERFDYELGVLLEAQGRDACAHWKRHRESFGNTRDEVRAALEKCKP